MATPTLMETLILQYSCSPYDHCSSSMFLSPPLWHQWQRVSLLGDAPPIFMHMLFHMFLSSYENKYVLRGTITNVLEREVAELGKLDGIHIYKVFTQTCTQFRILEGSLIRWNLVHLRGSQWDVKLKEISLEVEVNMWISLKDPLSKLEYFVSINFSYDQLVTTRPYNHHKFRRKNSYHECLR